jgi:hypothetical protein
MSRSRSNSDEESAGVGGGSGGAKQPLLRRSGATVAKESETVNTKLMHNPKFRAVLVQCVRMTSATATTTTIMMMIVMMMMMIARVRVWCARCRVSCTVSLSLSRADAYVSFALAVVVFDDVWFDG